MDFKEEHMLIGTTVTYHHPRWKNGDITGTVIGYYDDYSVFIKTPAGNEWIVKTDRITVHGKSNGSR